MFLHMNVWTLPRWSLCCASCGVGRGGYRCDRDARGRLCSSAGPAAVLLASPFFKVVQFG